jgi:hypothetical protein
VQPSHEYRGSQVQVAAITQCSFEDVLVVKSSVWSVTGDPRRQSGRPFGSVGGQHKWSHDHD